MAHSTMRYLSNRWKAEGVSSDFQYNRREPEPNWILLFLILCGTIFLRADGRGSGMLKIPQKRLISSITVTEALEESSYCSCSSHLSLLYKSRRLFGAQGSDTIVVGKVQWFAMCPLDFNR